jgi:hypothetical protein
MQKIIGNGCEGNGESLKTAPFKPIDKINQYISLLNNIYSGDADLFSLESVGNEVILHASTYLLRGNFEDDDNAEAELVNALQGEDVPEDLKQKLIDSDWSGDLAVGDIVELLIAPGQSVKVQITDPYENSEFTIEK